MCGRCRWHISPPRSEYLRLVKVNQNHRKKQILHISIFYIFQKSLKKAQNRRQMSPNSLKTQFLTIRKPQQVILCFFGRFWNFRFCCLSKMAKNGQKMAKNVYFDQIPSYQTRRFRPLSSPKGFLVKNMGLTPVKNFRKRYNGAVWGQMLQRWPLLVKN